MFWAGQGHNAIGRFYETFGNRFPIDRRTASCAAQSDRAWFRPNPPLPTVNWSLRNNVNYQQSGILLALSDFADRRQHFLEQFYLARQTLDRQGRERRSGRVGLRRRAEAAGAAHDLMSLLRTHGIEVQVADAPFT